MSSTESTGPCETGGGLGTHWVRTLRAIAAHARRHDVVRKNDLSCGDRVLVRTRNSVYSLWALGRDEFAVSGGWFDKQGASPAMTTINGCTYGGNAIRHDIVAARGLFLEFGNNVSTTRILDFRVVRGGDELASGLPSLPC